MRGQLQTATGVSIPTPGELAERIARWITAERGGLRPVINATGAILHPELSGPPLPAEAIAALAELAGGYAPLGLDLLTGQPADRDTAAATLLCRLTGAEAAHVSGTRSGGALVTLAALGAGREILVARSQIGHLGGRKVTELVAAAGASLREVGTTHQASSADFAAAISERTAAILLPTADDYAIVGATRQATLADLAPLARRHDVPLIHDLGLGGLIDVSRFGLAEQPSATRSIEAGADLALLAGNKLLGGPECGIIVGRRALIRTIKEHPLAACVPAGALALAALAATLRLYSDSRSVDSRSEDAGSGNSGGNHPGGHDPRSIERTIPLWSLLSTPLENLRNRAERVGPQIAATGIATVEIVEAQAALTGQNIPGQALPSIRLALTPKQGSAAALAATLRQGNPAVIGLACDARLLLDLRSVPPSSDIGLVGAIEALAGPKPPPPETPSPEMPPLAPS
jgi:L-seryl-tRNA(Ser) seleniumtransferase